MVGTLEGKWNINGEKNIILSSCCLSFWVVERWLIKVIPVVRMIRRRPFQPEMELFSKQINFSLNISFSSVLESTDNQNYRLLLQRTTLTKSPNSLEALCWMVGVIIIDYRRQCPEEWRQYTLLIQAPSIHHLHSSGSGITNSLTPLEGKWNKSIFEILLEV